MESGICTEARRKNSRECGPCSVRKVAASGDIPLARLDSLLAQVELAHYGPRAEIFEQDEAGRRVFVIRRGLVKLVHDNESGLRRTVRLLAHGDAMGLEVLVDGRYRHAAQAVEDLEVCALPTRVLADLDAHSQCMHRELMGQWQHCLDQADTVITRMSSGRARERVANYLLFVGRTTEGDPDGLMGRDEMAAILDLTTETVSRVMSDFRREGIVDDPAALKKVCQGL
ncbi:MAG: Crp/Fnr family transcriptional regulator [Rhodocyclaceae bacterium]|nr:Crp/Fnr family transcriptional regulator [Rhodocyclaceae bacterium]